jgi:hypothetical protein
MPDLHDSIDSTLRTFIEAQHMFFVATAPAAAGHINLSPKGLDTLRVLGPKEIAYLDHVGSGAETIAHVRENGRIVLMFCAFQGPPRILRLYGAGEIIEPNDPPFADLRKMFGDGDGGRAIVRVALDRVATSCGYGVPLYSFEGDRPQLPDWVDRKGVEGLKQYQRQKNRRSIDGLRALKWVDNDSPR